MHARELAELAALVAVHAPVIAQAAGPVPFTASQTYWSASKCRLQRWQRLLQSLAISAEQPPLPAAFVWVRVRPVLEEILASELLTRIWTATAAAWDAARGDQDLEPIARNIYAGHLDARRRLLALIADGRALDGTQAADLNQLRLRVERWTDMLLAHLSEWTDVAEFAFDSVRARDFAEDLDREAAAAERRFTCQLILSSVQASFAQGLADRSPNSDLNRKIGSAVLHAVRDELEGACGLVKSLWLERIHRAASDTETMIEELLRLEVS